MKKWLFIVVTLSLVSFSCKKKEELTVTTQVDAEEIAQQIGDTMSSIDEGGGGSGGQLALMKAERKTFARHIPGMKENHSLMSILVPQAEAAACTTATGWQACSNNVIVRDFGGCDIGGVLTVSGTVTFTFTDGAVDNTCQMASTGNYVLRNPNYTVTTNSGAVLTVTKTATFGQLITRLNPTHIFNIHNDGINRKLTFSGVTVMDTTTEIDVNDPIVVSGTVRTGRVITDGTIIVTDNLVGKTCTLQPSNVTWTAGCKCATSGSWTGSCSTGNTADVSITGCGTADIVIDGQTESVTFDRCY